MKIVLRSLVEEIMEANVAARLDGRTIKHIELTRHEYSELQGECSHHLRYSTLSDYAYVDGVKIVRGSPK